MISFKEHMAMLYEDLAQQITMLNTQKQQLLVRKANMVKQIDQQLNQLDKRLFAVNQQKQMDDDKKQNNPNDSQQNQQNPTQRQTPNNSSNRTVTPGSTSAATPGVGNN